MDIRMYTRCIVERNRQFLKSVDVLGRLDWTQYKYDAWYTRDLDKAFRVAWKFGGSVRLFNPVIGQVAKLRSATEETGGGRA